MKPPSLHRLPANVSSRQRHSEVYRVRIVRSCREKFYTVRFRSGIPPRARGDKRFWRGCRGADEFSV